MDFCTKLERAAGPSQLRDHLEHEWRVISNVLHCIVLYFPDFPRSSKPVGEGSYSQKALALENA